MSSESFLSNSNNGDNNPFASRNANPFAQNVQTSQKPSWLEDDQPSVPPKSGASKFAENPTSPTAQEATPADIDPEVPRMISYTRMVNLILSVCMIIASLLSILTTGDITTGVLACYVVVLSCLLCCYETHLKQISKIIALNFGFLYSAKTRCIFMLFIGTIMFSFSLFGKIVGIAMIVNAGFNFYVIIKHPTFDDAQRSDAQKEIQDYLAANPAFAKHAVSIGVAAVASNPDIARQGMEAYFGGDKKTSTKNEYSRI